MRSKTCLAAAALFLLATTSFAFGDVTNWTAGGGADTNWSNPLNWSAGLPGGTLEAGFALAGAHTVTLDADQSIPAATFSSGGAWTLTGPGVLTAATGVHVYGGTLAGGLTINGAVTSTGGTFQPGLLTGAVGTMNINGSLALDSLATLNYDLVSPDASDLITVTGVLTLDGTLHVGGSGYTAGDYTLITYSTTAGLIDNVLTAPTNTPMYTYALDTTTTPGAVVLKVGLNSLPGDVNGDGVVNASDIDDIYDTMFHRASYPRADVNGDGKVNQLDVTYELTDSVIGLRSGMEDFNLDHRVNFSDFQILLNNWQGKGRGWATGDCTGDQLCNYFDFQQLLDHWCPTGFADQPQSVPEPASIVLLIVGGLGLLRSTRRRRPT